MDLGQEFEKELEERESTSPYFKLIEGTPKKLVILEYAGKGLVEWTGQGHVPADLSQGANRDGVQKRYAFVVWNGTRKQVWSTTFNGWKVIGALNKDLQNDLVNYWTSLKFGTNKKFEARALKPLTAEEKEQIDAAEDIDPKELLKWLGHGAEAPF